MRADSITLLERPATAPDDSGRVTAGSVRLRALTRDGSPALELALPPGTDSIARRSSAARVEPMVSLIDAEGREVWTGRGMGREADGATMFGAYRVVMTDIARVEVTKGAAAPEGGLIQVYLKAGAKPAKP